jgi:hypothetical protein
VEVLSQAADEALVGWTKLSGDGAIGILLAVFKKVYHFSRMMTTPEQ